MELTIRQTTAQEYPVTETITRDAFWDVYKPGCDEHLVLNKIRKSSCYISDLDLVAIYNSKIIGHVISTRARVADTSEHEVLCVGPVSVLPEFQNKGAGSQLMNASVKIGKELGYCGMILFGNPDYYHRFGFKNAAEYHITTREGQNFEPFMALELQNNGFISIQGMFYEDQIFFVKDEELEEFEKTFPPREKHKTATQIF